MAANGTIVLNFAGQERAFNLALLGVALEHQELCDAGPQAVLNRILAGNWRIQDLRETVRLGLIGAGMKPNEAMVLVRRWVDNKPWAETVPYARLIMMAAIVGVAGDDVGKAPADRAQNEAGLSSETDALSDPQSTASAPPSDSHPAPSTP
jgi:hypothetical protein